MSKIRIISSVIFFVIVVMLIILGPIVAKEGDKKTMAECRAKGFECPSTLLVKRYEGCYNDCLNLGLQHFKFDRSGFGSDECWCKNEGIPTQIW